MSSNLDDFDDLDDYLDDPSRLDVEEDTDKTDNSNKRKSGAIDDPEVAGMVEDLQNEFEQLMKKEGEDADKETMKNFKQLLGALGEAGEGNGEKPQGATGQQSAGFKDIVSNTLDRLKENSNKVDTNLEKEKKQHNSDDVLSRLLDQLVDGTGDEEGMDNAILSMLNQMSSKEVLYQPMKEMQVEFSKWFEDNEDNEEYKEKMETYRKQYDLVEKIVVIYEKEDYNNDKNREEVTELLDQLEQLGDSPVSKGFNNESGNKEMDDLAKMLEIEGDSNLGNLDKDLEDTCKQQ